MAKRKRPTQKTRHAAAVRAVTPELYQQMLDAQGGGCAICGTPPKNRRLDIDTDHKNGFRVRGLLCHRHNRGLSFFGDDPAMLRAAAAYLERDNDRGLTRMHVGVWPPETTTS